MSETNVIQQEQIKKPFYFETIRKKMSEQAKKENKEQQSDKKSRKLVFVEETYL